MEKDFDTDQNSENLLEKEEVGFSETLNEETVPEPPNENSESIGEKNGFDEEDETANQPSPPTDRDFEITPSEIEPSPDTKYVIHDRMNDYRSYITEEGACFNKNGEIMGFINFDSFECGDASERFLGCVVENIIENENGIVIGSIDLGRGLLRDHHDSIIVEIKGSGELIGSAGTYLGQFEPFDFHDLRSIALYLFLIDPGMTNEIEG